MGIHFQGQRRTETKLQFQYFKEVLNEISDEIKGCKEKGLIIKGIVNFYYYDEQENKIFPKLDLVSIFSKNNCLSSSEEIKLPAYFDYISGYSCANKKGYELANQLAGLEGNANKVIGEYLDFIE